MANAIVEGIKEAGKEAEAVFVSDMNIDELKGEGVFALGVLPWEQKYSKRVRWSRLLQTWKDLLPERRLDCLVLTDGGTGQWMRDWEARMSGAGATIVGGEGVICQEAPDADAMEQCKALGKALANA